LFVLWLNLDNPRNPLFLFVSYAVVSLREGRHLASDTGSKTVGEAVLRPCRRHLQKLVAYASVVPEIRLRLLLDRVHFRSFSVLRVPTYVSL
jgi:hypothetical protein